MLTDELACLVIQNAIKHKLDRILNVKTFGVSDNGASV